MEAREKLGIDYRTLDKLIRRGELETIKRGNTRLIKASDVKSLYLRGIIGKDSRTI